ncbi:hypothetical protein GCM10009547_39790 [Sporichthya brevicatena]|uniref:SPW repeat-containing protein n=1 Tax=Sporichthya brevicatena TaxID=171442 RepID=A0ABN1H8W0_9ACTN
MREGMNPKTMLALLWLAAASVGLLVAAVPLIDDTPNAYLLGTLLIAASLPFGLIRPSVPILWAVVLAWPTVVIRLSQEDGWSAVLLLGYTIVGVYLGDWIGSWWAEKHPKPIVVDSGPAQTGPAAADGTALEEDNLPPPMPGRWTRASRRAEEEARHDTGSHEPPTPPSSITGLRP